MLAGCARGGPAAPADRSSDRAALDGAASVPPVGSATNPASDTERPAAKPDGAAERAAERARMVETQLADRDIRDVRVLAAMKRVPRHRFVPPESRDEAYTDRPLPIGFGQTISQPYIVAFMTQAVAPGEHDRCLEIGTGSGYQAAVLAELCQRVHSIEYLPEVARFGAANLRALGYAPERVSLRVGDGYAGWPEAAPFDVIVVTAAPDHVPAPLLKQLAARGRLVIPVGERDGTQELLRVTRTAAGSRKQDFERERLLSVRFVPFLGDRR
jgi:protein-L-isoaspartate(D-aspartate) O-methyltransferase